MDIVKANGQIREFKEALQAGIDGFVRCGEIYVEAIDEDPRVADKFRDEFSDVVPTAMWSNFEAIGRKWMHPRLIMGGMSNRKKANIVKRLPYSMQERIFEHERFDLLVEGGDVLKVDPMEATDDQLDQMFNQSGARSTSEQRAYIESKRAKEAAQVETPEVLPYKIEGSKVTFRRYTTLTRAELKRLLTEM